MPASNAHRNVSVDITGDPSDLSNAYDEAMRKSKKFSDEQDKNNRKNEDGIKRFFWATKDSLEKAGGEFGKLFTRTNGIIGLVLAGLLALGPAGQLVAGTLTLAFGAAFLSIGAAAALQHAAVAGEFGQLKDDVIASVKDMSAPLEQVFFNLPEIWRDTFSLFAPELSAAFSGITPHLNRFFENFSLGFAEIAPAIQPVMDGLSAVLDALGLQSPAIFGHFSDALITLAESAEKHADSFVAMIQGAFALVSWTADFLDARADEWSGFMSQVEGWLELVSGPWTPPDLDNSVATFDRLKHTVDLATDSIYAIAVSFDEAQVSADRMTAELQEFGGVALSTDLAAVKYKEDIEKLTAAQNKNTDGISLNTLEGSRNREELIKLAQKSHDYISAKAKEGVTVKELRGIYEVHRYNLGEAAKNLGANELEAKKLIDRYLKIPKSIKTKISADTEAAQRAVDNFIVLNSGRRIPIDVYNRNANLARGGLVGRDGYASGGPLKGPGGSRTDSIPINASRGEYVMNASATRRHLPLLETLNSGRGSAGVGGMTVIYQINTTVAPTANLAAVGSEIVKSIQAYEKGSGNFWRSN